MDSQTSGSQTSFSQTNFGLNSDHNCFVVESYIFCENDEKCWHWLNITRALQKTPLKGLGVLGANHRPGPGFRVSGRFPGWEFENPGSGTRKKPGYKLCPGIKTPSGGWGNSSEKATAGYRSPGGNLFKHFWYPSFLISEFHSSSIRVEKFALTVSRYQKFFIENWAKRYKFISFEFIFSLGR